MSADQRATELMTIAERVVAHVTDTARTDPTHIEANALVTRTRHGLTRFANSFIHQHVGEDTVRVMLTLAVDGRVTTVSTTSTDDGALRDIVARAVEAARLQPVDAYWPGATPPGEVDGTSHADTATSDARPELRADGVRAFIDAGGGLRAAGYLDTEATWAAFASTAGQRARGATTRATIDGIQQAESSAGAAHQTHRALDELRPSTAGAVAADDARRGVAPSRLEPGEFEVVLGPEAVATVLLFLAVYGLNAKAHLDGASFATVGTRQLDDCITLIEDPSDPRAIGLPFDAEGTPRRAFTLIDGGTVTALAHDRRTARRTGTTSTGNAVPGGASFGAIPLNPVLSAGDTSPADMVRNVSRGLYVARFHYCRILDPKTQVVTGLTRNGTFRIEDGELTGGVDNLRFTQSFVDALAPGAVLAVGDDDRYADAEFGPGMVICPSLRLASWRFTGGSDA